MPRGVAFKPGVVRDLRIRLGKTQVELGLAADVSVDTLGRAESGTPISLDSARAIAALFNVQLSALTADGEAEAQRGERAPAETNMPAGMVPRVFRGRDEALAAIEEALTGGDKPVLVTAPSVTALHGLRGVGKSVLAARYAELHRQEYRATWWVRSEAEAGLRADLAGLAVRLGWAAADATEEAALKAAGAGLRREGGGILLIFDNARDAAALRPYLPQGGGAHVIVTSNAPNWGRLATPVPIEVWPKETGGDFFVARAPARGDRAAAEALSEALGGLPLAHEMAASYCERTGLSFAGYRERLMAQAPALLDSGDDAPDEYHDRQTVAKAFALAIEAAAQNNPAAEALIALMALLPPEPIPRFLFNEGIGEQFADGLDAAVAALRDFALIDCEAVPDERESSLTTDTLRLHRLVREVAASRLDEATREAAQRVLISVMANVYPRDAYDDPKQWPRARRLDAPALALVGGDAPLPSGVEAVAGHLVSELALYQEGVLAAYAQAEPLYRRALAIAETALGSDHPNVATRLSNLAGLLRHTGRAGEAERLVNRALAIDEKHYGLDHPEVATDLNNLAGLLRATGRAGEAEPLYRRALGIGEKTLDPNHPHVAIRLSNLAGLLRATGRAGEAEPLCGRALAIAETALGADHPTVASCLNSLAGLLHDTGRADEAEPLFRRALAIDETALGPDHPDVANRLNNLAGLLGATGRAGEAEPLYRRALAIFEASLGPEHPSTVTVRQNLAVLLAGR